MSPRYCASMHDSRRPFLYRIGNKGPSSVTPESACGRLHMQSHLLESALKVITSEQVLVNIISRRVRQLTSGHRPLVEVGPRMGFADIALTEVSEGKLGYERTLEFIPEPLDPRRTLGTESTTVQNRAA